MILCMRKLLPQLARCDVCKTVHIVTVLYDTVFVGQTLNVGYGIILWYPPWQTLNVGYGIILWYPPLPNRMERYQLRLKCRHNLETPLGGRIQPGKRGFLTFRCHENLFIIESHLSLAICTNAPVISTNISPLETWSITHILWYFGRIPEGHNVHSEVFQEVLQMYWICQSHFLYSTCTILGISI